MNLGPLIIASVTSVLSVISVPKTAYFFMPKPQWSLSYEWLTSLMVLMQFVMALAVITATHHSLNQRHLASLMLILGVTLGFMAMSTRFFFRKDTMGSGVLLAYLCLVSMMILTLVLMKICRTTVKLMIAPLLWQMYIAIWMTHAYCVRLK